MITQVKSASILAIFLTGGMLTAAPQPLKALLLTGGCCHNYATQKDILKKGIEARANIIVHQIHTDNSSTKPDLPIYGNPDYAAGYDVVIHDVCAADISDAEVVKAVLAPHDKGMPGVALHCAMHSYRIGDFRKKADTTGTPTTLWFEFLGLQSTGHGKQSPIEIKISDTQHPINRGLNDWTTGNQGNSQAVVTWTNDYKGTKVFGTTIGHNDATVQDSRYLDLVTRGVLWAAGKINPEGTITEGYGPKK